MKQDYISDQPQNLDSTLLKRSDHFILIIKLENETIQVMINYKANRSYALIRLKNKLKNKKRQKTEPYPLIMIDGSSVKQDDG